MTTSELACVYSALILHDDGLPVTADKIQKLITAANVDVEPFWPGLFAKALENQDVGALISGAGAAAPAAAAPAAGDAAAKEEKKEEEEKPKEEEEEESDDDMGLGLFD
ncbi:large ribosomal subunit protein P1-like [Corticium candelabrum]|uniref:large ribosomal subunit protein P1-like n=1 Tax=Corticium candelabrum TaxID=121492 RepID=UPI002E2583E7|nr:large ribosomal subunit protein P1-like [Corticium candelabrum]